jgi:ubiquinol-cytochrome c reductase cytochrome b subunit
MTTAPFKNQSSATYLKALAASHNHLNYYPTPTNIFYVFGVGSLLGILLLLQVLTGVLLAMHYVPHVDEAFASIERIMR